MGVIVPIEYLEGTGTQWINTGFIPNQDTGIKAKVAFTSTTRTWESVFYSRTTSDVDEFTLQKNYTNGNIRALYGNQHTSHAEFGPIRTTPLIVDWDKNKIKVDKYSHTFTYKAFSGTQAMRVPGVSAAGRISPGKVWYFTIYDNGILVRDLIPVRVGNIGYMYDKVSGQLFGNAGTGKFILGPDVKVVGGVNT